MGKNNKRKTTNQFKQEIFDLVGNEYVVNDEYINAKTKLSFIHNIPTCMNSFDMTPSNFIYGQRCPKCRESERKQRDINILKINGKKFYEEVFNDTNGEYEVVGEYLGATEKIDILHNVCNEIFSMTPTHFKRGHRCTNENCLHSRWSEACINSNGFYEAFKKYKDSYEIIDSYNGYKNDMKFKHKVCGCIFQRSPNNFITLGDRCPKCTSITYKGENKIEEVLNQKEIYFTSQKSFDDLKGLKNGLLSYDFYLPQHNLLIEYQGEQHEYPIKLFGGEKQFKIQQEHDRRKREYAKSHGIQLLEIWYWDFDNIEKILESTLQELEKVV